MESAKRQKLEDGRKSGDDNELTESSKEETELQSESKDKEDETQPKEGAEPVEKASPANEEKQGMFALIAY